MATIFLSHSTKDLEIAKEFAEELRKLGHIIAVEPDALIPGDNWRTKLMDSLKNSEGVIALFTENSISSQFVISEVGAARAFIKASGDKFFIPVVLNNIDIPDFINDVFVLRTDNQNIRNAVAKINDSINQFIANMAIEKSKKQEVIKKIEKNATEYIHEALNGLEKREKENKQLANIFYFLGFVTLLGGAVYGFTHLENLSISSNLSVYQAIYLSLKSIIVIGMLIATSKYTFTLGKAYMNESLKNSDRTHAISLGKFYLQVYGENATWQELKEVFQHWNVNSNSNFSKLDSTDFDPKIIETLQQFKNFQDTK